ncbi:ATP-binding protein [Frankia sp. R82]|uniref:ATP-binding protein n=1 Tax=Frankia sp. R82 TaxID=2950553 RepID=UPI002042DA95|nr:ATP-binding protein [Frankia sp. R82]MCM3884306.1 ATP-binding protein [Frankia sp. R82]
MTHDLPPVIRVAVVHFPSNAAAVPAARSNTVRTLTAWSVDSAAVEVAELVACEITSNAVKASRLDDIVALRLTTCDAVLTVEVWDASTVPPALSAPHPDAEGGRGLVLVDALTLRWAWYLPRTGGKVVWAQLPATSHLSIPTDHTTSLPTRTPEPAPAPATPVTFDHDPALLQRVLDRLRGLDDWHRPPTGHSTRDRHHTASRHPEARPTALHR